MTISKQELLKKSEISPKGPEPIPGVQSALVKSQPQTSHLMGRHLLILRDMKIPYEDLRVLHKIALSQRKKARRMTIDEVKIAIKEQIPGLYDLVDSVPEISRETHLYMVNMPKKY